MQTVICRAVREGKLPVRVRALHDLDGVRHPLDAIDKVLSMRCATQAKADLGFDARSDQAFERYACAIAVGADESSVVHRAPDRLMYAVARPEGAIGEADLAAHRPPAACKAMLV